MITRRANGKFHRPRRAAFEVYLKMIFAMPYVFNKNCLAFYVLPSSFGSRRSPRLPTPLPERFGRCQDIGECLAINELVSTFSYELTCLSKVGCVVSMTPAKQTPKVGERLALGWKPSKLAQDKTPDHAPVPNPDRRRQCNNDICHVEAWCKPLVINPFKDPAILGHDVQKLLVALRGVGTNTVATSSTIPEKFVEIMGRNVKTLCELGGNI